MIRLFTAVGTYKLEESGIPVILAGGRECALDTHELLLWSNLAFRILTYQEAKAEFYAKERELHILSELDFDHYLNRLTMRRLIASGRDEVGVDALYDLSGHLYIEKTPSGLPAKNRCLFKPLAQEADAFPEGACRLPHQEARSNGKETALPYPPPAALHSRTHPVHGKGQLSYP